MTAERLREWRTALRLFIANHQNERLNVGDLFDMFGAVMPAHHAARMWCRGGTVALGDTPHDLMRWRAFRMQLHNLSLEYDPPLERRRTTRKTFVIAKLANCESCGKPFFGYLRATSCGNRCPRRKKNGRRDDLPSLPR